MKNIFLIDALETLSLEKDGSLLWALTAQEKGQECFFLFREDLHLNSKSLPIYKLYTFQGSYDSKTFSVKECVVKDALELSLEVGDKLHMRLDPPFDAKYLRVQWMLSVLESQGVEVKNSPRGLLLFNEKMAPLIKKVPVTETFVGSSQAGIQRFINTFSKQQSFVIKPLDLYQGLGVKKISREDPLFWNIIKESLEEFQGTCVLQPYVKKVEQGEGRSLFFRAKEIGSILKVPPEGSYLANIARGASYEAYSLSQSEEAECLKISQQLMEYGVDLVAFDLLDGKISEVNITCPGLLVEVSKAMGKNLTTLF